MFKAAQLFLFFLRRLLAFCLSVFFSVETKRKKKQFSADFKILRCRWRSGWSEFVYFFPRSPSLGCALINIYKWCRFTVLNVHWMCFGCVGKFMLYIIAPPPTHAHTIFSLFCGWFTWRIFLSRVRCSPSDCQSALLVRRLKPLIRQRASAAIDWALKLPQITVARMLNKRLKCKQLWHEMKSLSNALQLKHQRRFEWWQN